MERPVSTWPRRLLARPWLLAFVPFNAATNGFGVALPLLILIPLHGSWTDVALAGALFNSSLILASIAWGWVSDHYPGRRDLLLVNFGGFAIVYLVLAQTSSIGEFLALYTFIGLLAPAGASASNLLILEKFTEAERANAYASFQEMSILGAIAGVLVGVVWVDAHEPLGAILYVLSALAALSVLAVWVGVHDATHSLGSKVIARHPEGLVSRLRHGPLVHLSIPFFPSRPKISRAGLARFRLWVREELRHELPLILVASLLFNLSANLFNLSYTPYLHAIGLGVLAIFLVSLGNAVAQGICFPVTGTLSNRFGADRLVHDSTYVRSLGYLAVAGFTFVPVLSIGFGFGANLVAFSVLGGAIAFYSTASSLLLFRALKGRDAGTLIGLNSALGGIAAVGGAVLAGVLSVVGSYRLTFLVAAGALIASVPLWTAAAVSYVRRGATWPSPTDPAAGTARGSHGPTESH